MRYKKCHIILFILFTCVLFVSCGELFGKLNSVDNRTVFRDVELKKSPLPEKCSVLILSDLHFPNSSIEKIISKIENNTFPHQSDILFCAVLGDIATGASVTEYLEFQNFKKRLEACGIEVFAVPGNHDFFDSSNNGYNYMQYVSPNTFYRLITNELAFYFLDTADGLLGNNQYGILKNEFSHDNRTKIVFAHDPFYTKDLTSKMLDFQERARFTALLASSNVKYYFCGHVHKWETYNFGNLTEVVINQASVGYCILNVDKYSNCTYSIYYIE